MADSLLIAMLMRISDASRVPATVAPGAERPGAGPRSHPPTARRHDGDDPAENAPLRRAGVVILVLFGLLFADLNWVQAYKADGYRTSDYNRRVVVAQHECPAASSRPTARALAQNKVTDDMLKYLGCTPRRNSTPRCVGYRPVNLGGRIERSETTSCPGSSDKLFANPVNAMFTGNDTGGGNVVLTLKTRRRRSPGSR